MTTTEPTREFIDLKQMEPWGRNPRGVDLGDIEGFMTQVKAEGGIREDVHVFRAATGRLTLMQGHRRYAVAQRMGMTGLWTKIWPFGEEEAFLHLLTMQNGADPFDARELAAAASEAMKMGITKEALVGAMHRSEETVQLYLDLVHLPQRVREAVYEERIAMGTAGLLRQLTKEQMELALPGLLRNPITNEPMSEAQARVYIQNTFLKPAAQAKEWLVVGQQVKRKLSRDMDSGLIDVVAWEDRDEFVASGALPQSAYERCDAHIEDKLLVEPGEPMTWGELARSHGVPWHVCAAPVVAEKHVLLVKRSAVVDADDVAEAGTWVLRGKSWRGAQQQTGRGGEGETGRGGDSEYARLSGEFLDSQSLPVSDSQSLDPLESPSLAVFFTARWDQVAARLMARPENAMQDGLWKPLIQGIWRVANEALPNEVCEHLAGVLLVDESNNRKGLRQVLLAVLALSMVRDGDEALVEVERVLGINDKLRHSAPAEDSNKTKNV